MAKHDLTAAEEKLLMKGFDYATDLNGFDPSWDDMDVLKVLESFPNLTAVPISLKANIPVHRVVAAIARLKTSGKLPTVEPLDNFTKTKELQVNYLKLVNPVCSTGNIETVEPELKPDIPHWLTGRNEAEAKALCNELGFWFVGTIDEWGEPEAKKIIETSGDWSFNYDQIGMFVEARVNGAVFNIDVEETNNEDDWQLVDKAIAIIKEASEQWGLQFGEQLELNLDCEQSQNILLQEPPRQVEANRIEVGDRVQLTADLRRIGEVKSISSKAVIVRYCDGFEFTHTNEEGIFNLFSKANSDVVLGESFFKVGERVKTSAPGHEEKIFTVNAIHYTGMIGVTLNENSLSFPANWLEHHIEEIKPVESKPAAKKRPSKGCGTGYLTVRQANKKRNAAKGREPDIYYVYSYSYTDLWGKEIKSSISVPRDKISRVKSMIENREHYVKICKFLGKTVGCWY